MSDFIDQEFLTEVGIDIKDLKVRQAKIDELTETLEELVGNIIVEHLSQAQIDEFEQLLDSGDEEEQLVWLKRVYPAYNDVVNETYNKFKADLKLKRL
jgi:hypothetical protein